MTSTSLDLLLSSTEELVEQLHGEQDYIELQYQDLYEYDSTYAMKLIEQPLEIFKELESISRGKKVRLKNLLLETKLYQINPSNLFKLLQIRGVVTQINEASPKATKITYICEYCQSKIIVDQDYQWKQKPDTCPHCEKGRKYRQDFSTSKYEFTQWVTIQELVENTPTGSTPKSFKILMKDDFVGILTPGEEVTIVGILVAEEKSMNTSKLEMDWYIKANNVIRQKEDESDFNLSTEEINQIQEWMSQPDHLEKIMQSFAPTIYGLDHVKEALAYQQCEGVRKHKKQTTKRGQFHVLLTGPPGVGKSELGSYSAQYHIKGRETAGRGASGVGLTASVTQEDGEWVLKAGAMVLADNGLLFIDELEKMSKDESGMIHPGMEAQEIPINKAGINAVLKTRCSVLAACNPLAGEWDDYKTLVGNLHEGNRGLPIPLLNRFALIYVIRNNKKKEEEEKIAEHITKVMTGELEDPPYNFNDLRKIFVYARTLTPSIPREVMVKIKDFYMILYEASQAENTMIISRRQIEDIIRITEASTKLHGREVATIEDAENAIRVVSQSVKEYGIDPTTGKIDQNIIYLGEPKSNYDRLQELPEIISDLSKHSLNGTQVMLDELRDYLTELWGVSESEVDKLLRQAKRDGVIYYPGTGRVSLV